MMKKLSEKETYELLERNQKEIDNLLTVIKNSADIAIVEGMRLISKEDFQSINRRIGD